MSDRMRSKLPFAELPEGTVTFLFTDIEGSTQLLHSLRDQYAILLADQHRILREAFTTWNGNELDTQGDAFFVAFQRATDAVAAGVEAQRVLAAHTWPEGVEVRVRMGLHTGEPWKADEGYVGMDVHRAARIAHIGHGGQILLSVTTAELVRDELPEGVTMIDLGKHRLKDIPRPEHIRQLVIVGLPSDFPPLNSLEALPLEKPLEPGLKRLPAFLEVEAEKIHEPRPIFVARERELARLNVFLERTLDGDGQVVFIIGGPGRGKTALLNAFTRRTMTAYPALLAVNGECSAYTGVGDPYLPFRSVMSILSGDLESRWVSGMITREHALRLWEALPLTFRALVEHGSHLIDVFVSGEALLGRARAAIEGGSRWLERLNALCERESPLPEDLKQRHLFEQYEEVLGVIAVEQSLVLVLDDLQWADTGSINLLFHLGRRLSGRQILILCAYRPEEVALGRGGVPHPLEKVLAEFKRQYGEIWIDLSEMPEAEGTHFVEAVLDNEPNRLSEGFRRALYEHTEGHPLFTVELLRNLQERDDLILDKEGCWVESPDLNWNVLPPRVEGVIEERIGRLEQAQKETLSIASVEGEEFSAQVVARMRKVDERGLVRQLSQELDKKHRLVAEQGFREVGPRRLYLYRFRHSLFQQHLYNTLGDIERAMLHGDIGTVMEELYGERVEDIAPQLARHFTEAGKGEKAVHYLLSAGDKARMVYAHSEAVDHYRGALALLEERGEYELAARTLMKLGLVYTAAFEPEKAREAYDKAFMLWEPLRESMEIPHRATTTPVLRFAVAEPLSLDPGKMGDDISSFIAAQVFEGLVSVDSEYNVLPAVAARWEMMDEGMRYIFHLREGLRWSDGETLTAADFEYAWKRNLALESHSPVSHLLYVIENARAYNEGKIRDPGEVGVTALNDLTLEVRLEAPTAYLPHLLALSIAYPLPRWAVEGQVQPWTDPANIVSNGAFQLSQWKQGDRLLLRRNPLYRGRFPGNVDRVECPIINDYQSAFEAYEDEALDVISMITADPGTVARANRLYGRELVFTPQPSTFYLVIRVDRLPFSDVRVRRAFIHAVDRHTLFNVISQGQYVPATGGFIPPGMPGHSSGIGQTYDPERARDLLAQAGYPGGRGFPVVSWIYCGGKASEPVVPFLRKAWGTNLGLDIVAQNVEWKEFIERLEGDPASLTLTGWRADYQDPDYMLRVPFHSTEGINTPRWKNARFDSLVDKAAGVVDQNERIKLYQTADHILVAEQAAIMPLGYAQGRMLVKPWVALPHIQPAMMPLKEVVLHGER